jgi:hypothetical protein
MDIYGRNGVHQMKCMDCPLKYIGHTGRTFYTRHKEHLEAIRNNNINLGYSNHILSTGHAYRNITDTMETIEMERKGKHLNTLEKYNIYKLSRSRLHMYKAHIDTYNPNILSVARSRHQIAPCTQYKRQPQSCIENTRGLNTQCSRRKHPA